MTYQEMFALADRYAKEAGNMADLSNQEHSTEDANASAVLSRAYTALANYWFERAQYEKRNYSAYG